MRLASDTEKSRGPSWPSQPYKGLNYYGPEDISIFAGREQDIEMCASLLISARTSILIVHGSTGCGKSSFLRAGLIPLLERREQGYAFVRSNTGEMQAHFVRSTDDPLSRLAESIFRLANQEPIIRSTPSGSSVMDLSQCLPQESSTLQQFVLTVTSANSHLVDSLACIARNLPQTLVLIVDQVEEMLTLRPGSDGEGQRTRFFDFLSHFMDRGIDIKIILAIRTEYFGRLIDELRQSVADTSRIEDYLLRDLTEKQLIQAIVRPTLDQPVGNFGTPRNYYRFKFAPSVPQAIADDLRAAVPAGGILPVMQIACGRLYKLVKMHSGDKIAEITRRDFEDLGGIEGQIEGHLNEALAELCEMNKLSPTESVRESKRWRKVLLGLAKSQVDGTVTTEVKPAYELLGEAGKAGCKIPAGDAFELLSKEENRVLRPVTVYNPTLRTEIPCYALGHDAIGLVLRNWTVTGDRATRIVDGMKSASKAFWKGLLFMLVLGDIIYAIGSKIVGYGFDLDGFTSINVIGGFYILAFYLLSKVNLRIFARVTQKLSEVYGVFGRNSVSERFAELAEEAMAAMDLQPEIRFSANTGSNLRKLRKKSGARVRRTKTKGES